MTVYPQKISQSAYVAGLMFSECRNWVGLIEKIKPRYQAGKLNAIGGKIELNETPIDAMIREFFEETGVQTDPDTWQPFVLLHNNHFQVYFYTAFTDKLQQANTTTEERVAITRVRDIPLYAHLPNLQWLIPLALDKSLDRTDFITIREV